MRKIVLFANPLSASRRRRDLHEILQVFQRAGVQVERLETGSNRAAGEKAKLAVKRGVDAIVVCGGDGTVFDVLQGVAGSAVPLGIIPFGTGNVLAQNLRIPLDAIRAARWLIGAKPRHVPLGKITCCVAGGTQSWFFAIAAGMGMHAAMMQAAHRFQKQRVGKTAYVGGGLKTLLSHPVQPFEMRIETVEGAILERLATEAIALRVGKLNLWRPGGNLDSPFLRLASVESESRWRLAKASFEALLLGAGRRKAQFVKRNAAHYENVLSVECKPIPAVKYKPPIPVQADGEILGASYARIEMAGVTVRFLSRST